MGAAIITLAGLTGIAAVLIIGSQTGVFAGNHGSVIPSVPSSPLDEAERILATRYAKGEITPDEYARMLSILRR
jgi:uncharacterized membrane protein